MATPDAAVMLSEMSGCAYRLGMAFGRAAEGAQTEAGRLERFELFERCFFAVRVATALQLRLQRGAFAPAAPVVGRAGEPAEAAEREPSDAGGRGREAPARDRERERETEPASLPALVRALEDVVAGAAALPGRPPAELAALRGLIAQARPARAAAGPRSATIRPGGGLRARLSGSAVAMPPPAAPAIPCGPALAVRRATGPPPR